MDNSRGDEPLAEIPREDPAEDTTTEEEDATHVSDLDRFIETLPARSSQALQTISAMSRKRNVALRPHKECIIEPGARRNCNQEAALCQTRGDVSEEPCLSCSRGNGIFQLCITVPGLFDGACGNCRYNGSGSRCSHCNPIVVALKAQVQTLGKDKTSLEDEVAVLRAANAKLTHEMKALVGMSYEEFEEHKAHLDAALIILKMNKSTS